MSDPLFTSAHLSLLKKMELFIADIPAGAEKSLAVITSIEADVAQIKADLTNGDIINIVPQLKADYAALKTEFEAFKSDVAATASQSHVS